TVLLITFNTTAEEILFSEDFQSGEISDQWTFYGDPVSVINSDCGNPAPCFNNNGDSMWSSGIKYRRTFSIKDGLVIQCDIYLSCHPRGAWVGSSFGITDPASEDSEPSTVVVLKYIYSGELNWNQPHLQGMLVFSIMKTYRGEDIPVMIHMNQWLDGWHTFKIEISPDDLCSFSVDDSVLVTYQTSFPDSLGEVGIFLGGRATSWGTALHDNLLVYVP
ncbi:MAG: hypothetical protein KAH31_10750, partial [Candidatus Sabulitectum sp.]|nr:hypothetical protein [Candidatus Sabulitectum sp.]